MRAATALRDLINGGIAWDNHACMRLDTDCAEMAALDSCREAGVDVISLNVASGDQTVTEAIRILAAFRNWVAQRPDKFVLIGSVAAAIEAKRSGRLAICFDIEGMSVLDGSADLVSLFYDLGVRWMLSAYNHGNAVGGGCLDATDAGLTSFGRAVVGEMNRVGMVICGSHAGDRTARELIDASEQPIIFSHSNPRAMWNSPRNIPDDVMRACARRGGVVGINGIGAFLGPNDARIETFVQHVEYALALLGEDHVGIALDYCFGMEGSMVDFAMSYPALFPTEHGYARDGIKMIAPWKLADIADLLSSRGVKAPALAKLFGGNHLRIAETVWR
jgi:membrane dipeptidase